MADKREFAISLLLDFVKYVEWIHGIAQGGSYDMTPGHIKVCKKLQEYAEGKNTKRNLMINVYPGFGKSLLLQYFITWCFARDKNCMFCYIAYGEKLIKKLSRESRNLMMTPEWVELFGKEMDPNDKSVLNYHLISGGVRSGLTAGTISSAILGLDAGNPSSELAFSGALLLDDINSPEVRSSVHEQYETPETYQRKLATRRRTPTTPTICIMQRHCFVPGTMVWTEDGIMDIERIVESRYSGRVWSFNFERKRFELAEIEEYIETPLMRQEIWDIAGVLTTGEHRVITQRGVVLARDIKAGDKLICASDSLNYALGDFKFIYYILLPVACITNVFNFIGSKVARFAKAVSRNAGSATVGSAVFNPIDSAICSSVFRRKRFYRARVICDFNRRFCRKGSIISNKAQSAISNGIGVVFGIRAISKIIKRIVGAVIVKVAGNSPFRAWANKCFQNKGMDAALAVRSVFTKRDSNVPAGRATNKTVFKNAKKPSFIRNTIQAFITNYIAKNFIHTIPPVKKKTIKTKTYCIKVKGNSTLIAGKSQFYLFGNCENDFAGWVEKAEAEDWEFLVIPALDESGESTYPKRYPKEDLEKLAKRNPYLFAAMYQQKPLSDAGLYFHEEWIRTYRTNPDAFQKVFITTDFGFTSTGDKSVFGCWGLAKDNNLYLLRSVQGKWEAPDAKKQCVDFFKRCAGAYRQCRRVYVENTLSGIGFIQDMRRECPQMAIVPLRRGAKKNKMNRAESAMTWMEAGRVYFRESDPNYIAARSEFLAYNPSDRNPKDEWVDNTGDACEIAFNTKTSSIFI